MKKIDHIFYILTAKERSKIFILLFMVVIMAFLDMLGLASIMPFITVLVNPDLVNTNSTLNTFFQISKVIGIETKDQFLFFLGIFSFLLLVISACFKALTIYFQTTFGASCQHNLAKRMTEEYLNQPYVWFLNRHSADIGKNILSEANTVIGRGLAALINLVTQIIVSIVLVGLVLFIDFKFTLIASGLIGGFYLLIFYFFKNNIKILGEERVKANKLCFTSLVESFGAFKEVKVGGLEKICVDDFSQPSKILTRNSALIDFISKVPRLIIEVILFGGLILVALYLMIQNGTVITALPSITVFVLVAYRLIPALQNIYHSFSQLNFVGPTIENLYNDLKSLDTYKINNNENKLRLNDKISLKNVNYRYPSVTKDALSNINLTIPARSTIGFVGSTGSGKTTLVDIILSLLEVTNGELKVDNEKIDHQNYRSWQRNIGYVPQQIYLADTSIARNIAFGIDPKSIKNDKIENVAKIAKVHDFVINEMSSGYDTVVGERGVRLSGGQKQRIGIARALYNNPQLLILDEATSALDNQTEEEVINEIYKLKKNITIIMIAHRLSTIRKCDKIFHLENGKLKSQGTYDEVISSDGKFNFKSTNT